MSDSPRAIAIIPARLGSTRFPGKVLASETGRPLVQHVVEGASAAPSVQRVVVACDDEQIAAALAPFGTECVLTRTDHPNGTSRLLEAAQSLGLPDDALVVNVQGDEPEIEPGIIDAAVESVRRGERWAHPPAVGTVASPFAGDERPDNPAIVKAVVGETDAGGVGRALYFSRALVPHHREGGEPVAPLKHVGIYAYRVASLRLYAGLSPTPLERCEQLEQLRWLEHGHAIAVAVRRAAHHGVDTPEQYAEFVRRYRGERAGG
ncbi:MAG: 3-deoxy-manno-octulosonate cytidylyltransferase [Phycisphaerales bacterium JB040]